MSDFKAGLKDGIPIGLGYLAVSFSLGIAARNAGFDWIQGFVASLTCIASAGEYALFSLAAVSATYLEVALMTLVANARYLLMSCALSQRFDPKTGLGHRLGVGFFITDEIFGIEIARPGYIKPAYTYGAALTSILPWAIGTSLGIIAGDILPAFIVSALSVAIYGMFIAIIVPPAKNNRVILIFVLLSFIASYLSTVVPFIKDISAGTKTIILTVVLASLAAILFPVNEEVADE